MAYSYSEIIASGGNTFNIPFDYIEQSEISVFVDGVSTSFTFTSSNVIDITPAPAQGAVVRITRDTNLTNRVVDFASGAVLTEEDLDNSNIQLFHSAQEAIDKTNSSIALDFDGKLDASINGLNRIVKNVAGPVDANDAVNKDYLENTWLSPSDKAQLNALNIPNLHAVANNVSDVNTVAADITDVSTVADNISYVGTVAENVADVNTVAIDLASFNNVGTVAGISANVTKVADIDTDVTTVAAIDTNVTTVADIDTDVTTVAGISSDVTTVADNNANVTATGSNITNVNTVAGISSNVTTVAGIDTDVTTVAGISTDVSTVSTNNANVTTTASNILDVGTVADNVEDVNTVATNVSDVSAVATDIASVVNASNNMAAIIAAPTEASAAANSATASANSATAAQNAQTAAELARDQAFGATNVYTDTTAGLAGTVDGDYFSVASTGNVYVSLYRNDSGSATLINQAYGVTKVDEMEDTQITTAFVQAAAIAQIQAQLSPTTVFPA